MKNVTLKIIGRQIVGGEDLPQVEFVTEGSLHTRGKTLFLSYNETELSGIPGCTTQLAIAGGVVKMSRKGDILEQGTEIRFEKGKRYTGTFDTPYGSAKMEVLTPTELVVKINE